MDLMRVIQDIFGKSNEVSVIEAENDKSAGQRKYVFLRQIFQYFDGIFL